MVASVPQEQAWVEFFQPLHNYTGNGWDGWQVMYQWASLQALISKGQQQQPRSDTVRWHAGRIQLQGQGLGLLQEV